MKNNPLLKRMVAISVISVVVWLFWPTMPQHSQRTIVNEPPVTAPLLKAKILPVKTTHKNIPLVVTPKKITSNESASLVAKVFAAELKFPTYSKPLTNNDFDRLKPNHFNPQSIPVDDDGAHITAALSKYRYTYPEPVFATLTGENIVAAELHLVDISSGELLLTSTFEQDEQNWKTEFDGKRNFPTQLQATIKAFVNGRSINIALSLKYVDSVATLEGFDSAVNQDADMVIQANLTTREQGLYRMRANLFDANHQPIAHLVSKEKLNKGSGNIYLKAHQSVLQGKQAPFYLSTFTIELLSPAPGIPTKYGDSSIDEYKIKDFSISSLSDTPYQPSEHEQQRLQLLQKMSQGR